jgi:hypothetical protein
VTLDLLIAVALDHALLTSLHRRLLRWGIGSSGAEGLASGHLTSSLDNSTSIAPMPAPDPSVKLVLLSFSHLAQYARPNAPMHGHRCIRQPSGIYGFPLYFGTSAPDWTCHLDGGLDLASRR